MNARQKAKRLKKELEEMKADKTNGFKWLKIDGISIKEEPRLWYDNTRYIFNEPPTYIIRIGQTQAEFTPINPDDTLIIIDSKKLDEAIMARRKVDKCKT